MLVNTLNTPIISSKTATKAVPIATPPPPEEGDYDSYWHMRRGAEFHYRCDKDFGEYPFPE